MGRRVNWPPKPHVHAASGQERVTHKGRHHYLGKAGSIEAKRAYLRLLDELEPPGENQPPPPPTAARQLTIAELAERFDAEAQARYDPAGREARQFRSTYPPLLAAHGSTPACGFGVSELEQVRDAMIALDWQRETINRRVSRVRTMFRWAERKGLVPPGAWAALRVLEAIPPNDRRVRTGTPRQPVAWADLARACRRMSRTARDIILCLYFTGARPGELSNLLVSELDTSGEVWVARPARHKNAWRGHRREIVIGPKARKVIEKRLPGLKPGDYVFTHSFGTCYSNLNKEVLRACELAGVKFTAYQCRHAAKANATREFSLEHARAALGQKSILMTDHYAGGVDRRLADDVARRIG